MKRYTLTLFGCLALCLAVPATHAGESPGVQFLDSPGDPTAKANLAYVGNGSYKDPMEDASGTAVAGLFTGSVAPLEASSQAPFT